MHTRCAPATATRERSAGRPGAFLIKSARSVARSALPLSLFLFIPLFDSVSFHVVGALRRTALSELSTLRAPRICLTSPVTRNATPHSISNRGGSNGPTLHEPDAAHDSFDNATKIGNENDKSRSSRPRTRYNV